MAAAAASSYEVFGFESAVVPFDLCVEAEALGCDVDFQSEVDGFLAPVVNRTLAYERRAVVLERSGQAPPGRVPLVAEALGRLQSQVGREVLIGAWVPGPFTLAWQLFGAEAWLSALNAGDSASLLAALADFLAHVAELYRRAGADFVTVHEMGGSPHVVGPNAFRSLVQPALQRLLAQLRSPKVLSVCGDTNAIVDDLAACAADALSLDQRNRLVDTRRRLGGAVLLGNIDPIGILSRGTPGDVARAARYCVEAGVNAVWPGCDLYPDIPDENMRALMDVARP